MAEDDFPARGPKQQQRLGKADVLGKAGKVGKAGRRLWKNNGGRNEGVSRSRKEVL